MSVLVLSDIKEIRLDCESKCLERGFLDFNVSCTLKNIEAWFSTKKVKVLFIGFTELSQSMLDLCLGFVDGKTKVYILDQDDNFIASSSYDKVSMVEWRSALLQELDDCLVVKPAINSILIKVNTKYVRIKITDIEYVSSEGKFVNIAIKDKIYSTRSQLKTIVDLLPDNFILVHRSYLLNLDKIKVIQVNEMEVELDDYRIPFSRKHKQALFDKFHLGY